ncbi:MAG TPA: hypothetical protein VFS67_21800 [Polyangiaceae bacterium]|nr:hypothetical protein [Polyangiaceae bacterium]
MGGPHTSRDAGQVCKDCSEPPLSGGRRCKACRAAHNDRERERRAELKRKHRCWACGEPAVKDERGQWLSTCQAHRGTAWRTG